jgi:hypothetical protein
MNEDELRAWAKEQAAMAPPLSPAQKDAIASAFRSSHTPQRHDKLRGKK